MISIKEISENTFEVKINDSGETIHKVTITNEDVLELSENELSKEELLRLSFEFLLTKEPKEHILPRFNIMIIANYFPDYKDWLKSKI